MRKLFDILKKYDYVVVFLLLIGIALLLMARTTYYQSARITAAVGSVTGSWYKGIDGVSGYFGLKRENDRLAAENARLRAQVAESYINYTDSIFEVNDTVYRQRYSYTETRVIKNSWTAQNNYIIIGKGSDNGIERDMAVISPQGIVGTVISTSAHFSIVLPVLHPDSRNSVKVLRTGTGGSLVWDGKDYRYAQVIDLPTTHQLNPSDTIVTSGLAGDFPEGIPVGYVESTETVKGTGFYKVHIRLATDFNRLDHVYVINNHFRKEQQQLSENIPTR